MRTQTEQGADARSQHCQPKPPEARCTDYGHRQGAATGPDGFEAKAINVKRSLEQLREEVMNCFQNSCPAKQLSVHLILELVKMGMLEARLKNTFNHTKRKEMLQQFIRSKKAIEYWVSRLGQSQFQNPRLS